METLRLKPEQNVQDIDIKKWYLIGECPKPLKFVNIKRQPKCFEDIETWRDKQGVLYECYRGDWNRSEPQINEDLQKLKELLHEIYVEGINFLLEKEKAEKEQGRI